jgi:hypothetical protein
MFLFAVGLVMILYRFLDVCTKMFINWVGRSFALKLVLIGFLIMAIFAYMQAEKP